MNSETLKDLIEVAAKQAELVIIKQGKNLMALWVLIDAQDKISIIGTPWRNDLEKRVTRLALQKFIRENQVVAYSFVTEAWSSAKPADWHPGPGYQGASREPNRREIVIAFATDGKTHEFRSWAIQRDWQEKVCALKRLDPEHPRLQGWMTELL